jgi:hypothetical protein
VYYAMLHFEMRKDNSDNGLSSDNGISSLKAFAKFRQLVLMFFGLEVPIMVVCVGIILLSSCLHGNSPCSITLNSGHCPNLIDYTYRIFC